MNGLTNRELEAYCKKFIGKSFLGVYPCDSHPKNLKKFKNDNVSFIYNLSPHYENGSHFVAILKLKDTFYFFDSYGKLCKNKDILKFLKLYTNQLICNTKIIQAKNSIFCGLYCLAFLLTCQKNKKSMKYFVSKFSKPLKKNDNICLTLILKNKPA